VLAKDMSAGFLLWSIATAYAVFWSTYVVLLPLVATLPRRQDSPVKRRPDASRPSIAVIVPAHNMEQVITRCIASLADERNAGHQLEIYVVADHCTDNTADLARHAGAEVLTRNEGSRGKTYTLAWAIATLKDRGADPDMYVIVDATARIEAGFFDALTAHWSAGENIVVSHPVVDAANQQWFARCLGLTLAHRNLQNRARQRLGLSSLIEGRGMAYSRRYIKEFGWRLALPTSTRKGSHPTEDWRHAVQAVSHGFRVAFADDARVVTPLRDSLGAATQQGARWERGRMLNAGTHALKLLMRGIRDRSRIKTLAALDAIQPPVAILGVIAVILAAFSFSVPVSTLGTVVGMMPFALFLLYGLLVVAQGRKDGIEATAVLWAPVYLAWRFASFMLAWVFVDKLNLSARRKPRERA
jgi:cellulose synthase/poly-beta-1,6-N-acetylglucosamine synthase-like glycosyltransferase